MTDSRYQERNPVTGAEYDALGIPRYTGFPTLLRVPRVESLDGLDVALIGVPYDGGVTNRPGARHGPREVRNQSSLIKPVHHVTRLNPHERLRLGDVGDVLLEHAFELPEALEDIRRYYRTVHEAGVRPLTVGGDHSITYPILGVLGADEPVGMVHIDAHADTWDDLMGCRFHHGAPFRRAVEDGLLDPRRCVQIGIRGSQYSMEAIGFSLDHGMRVVTMEELTGLGVDGVVAEARRVVGDGPVYVTFDIDALDPVYAPGTGTPEVGGLTTREAQQLLRGLSGIDVIGGDVVEVAPPWDSAGVTALAGATLLFEILCLLADSPGGTREE
ncbi:agmatinase [Streptomyces sp. LZ34]